MASVVVPKADIRVYKAFTLDNGVRAVVIQDREVAFAAACASVQVGYFDDPPSLPGLAHFLEHAVHLGSEPYPDEKEYKAFLAQHGGSSNAATDMVHTKYHLKVAAHHLGEALDRMGAMLACPLLSEDCLSREVEAVHAEYSRNRNSDARRVLQLRRSLGRRPYSQFSTGSIATLRDTPRERGLDVAAEMRELWQHRYLAPATTVAVVGPQDPPALERWVRDAFRRMRACGEGGWAGAERYGSLDVYGEEHRGTMLRVAPKRDLRTLEMVWFMPFGATAHADCKPWRVAGHALGHESYGSAAHLLKRQGLIQSLSAGMGEEVRLGRGFMFWRIEIQLTQLGEDHVPHVLGTVARSMQLLRRASSSELSTLHSEAAALSALKFDWRDAAEPVSAAKEAAYNLHYYPPEKLLTGPGLIGAFDEGALRSFVDLLQPSRAQVVWSSKRWSAKSRFARSGSQNGVEPEARTHSGLAFSREQWYGAGYCLGPLEASMEEAIRTYCQMDECPSEAVLVSPSGGAAEDPAGRPVRGLAVSDGGAAGAQRWVTGTAASGDDSIEVGEDADEPPEIALPGVRSISLPGESAASGTDDRQQRHHQQQGPPPAAAGPTGVWSGEAAAGGGTPGPWPPRAGELHLPRATWGIPSDMSLRAPRGAARDWRAPPDLVVDEAGLCCWHRLDTSFGLPKAHVKLHLLTPAAYESPAAAVAARLLLRIAEDVLTPDTYVAEVAGSSFSLEALQTGVKVSLRGFPDVLEQLLPRVLGALAGITEQQVCERFATMAGRLRQSLTNWRNNNPAQHAEYAAQHLLQARHHHVEDLLAALARTTPSDVLRAARLLAGGGGGSIGGGTSGSGGGSTGGAAGQLHVDMLAYGNLSAGEAAALCGHVRDALRPGGLHPCMWTRGRVIDLSPTVWPLETDAWLQQRQADGNGAERGGKGAAGGRAGAGAGGCAAPEDSWVGGGVALAGGRRGVSVVYRPANPNPSDENHAIYYVLQIGPDNIRQQVLLEAFVQAASRPCFQELRTKQGLGYSVSLHTSTLQRTLALAVRVQSPGYEPWELMGRVGRWLAAYRGQLEAMPVEELENHKRALQDRYLERPKSLSEAALRAWRPIERRSLDWARRQHKAEVASEITLQDLLGFYDRHLSKGSHSYRHLCAAIRGSGGDMAAARSAAVIPAEAGDGGLAPGPGAAVGTATGAGHGGVGATGGACEGSARPVCFELEVSRDQLAAFKRSQPLLPAAQLVLKPGDGASSTPRI